MTKLSHFDHKGQSQMVDVGEKPMSRRVAIASGKVSMEPATLALIQEQGIKKGNVLELARVAAIMATKRTAELIPLCHPLRLDSVNIEFNFLDPTTIEISATVAATDRTGVEMEALTAVSVAALTIYDMCKSVDRKMRISSIQLEEKSGGKSGRFVRDEN